MKVPLQTIICGCVLATVLPLVKGTVLPLVKGTVLPLVKGTVLPLVKGTVLPLVKGTKVDLNTNMKKRFRVWLQSRTRADFQSSSAVDSGILSGPGQREETDPSLFHSRSRRSIVTSVKRPGCSLGTCSLHDLAHRLHILNNKLKVNRAPEDKISSQGYGRRRRSPQSLPQRYAMLSLQAGRVRLDCSRECSQGLHLQAIPLRQT
ncbi:pro-adrenomedullin-like [Salmo salar]|uniref:Pro-adrenomedullin-like n=1 Tax=Salmo salar TaxID=8030 RepID=A0A1S3PDG5_SALSA|nr:pro-adrenomedullin-like [Salmo salar]|eukprot:XP_014025646.1 PREDICTED: ADM-like [Salmo salar]